MTTFDTATFSPVLTQPNQQRSSQQPLDFPRRRDLRLQRQQEQQQAQTNTQQIPTSDTFHPPTVSALTVPAPNPPISFLHQLLNQALYYPLRTLAIIGIPVAGIAGYGIYQRENSKREAKLAREAAARTEQSVRDLMLQNHPALNKNGGRYTIDELRGMSDAELDTLLKQMEGFRRTSTHTPIYAVRREAPTLQPTDLQTEPPKPHAIQRAAHRLEELAERAPETYRPHVQRAAAVIQPVARHVTPRRATVAGISAIALAIAGFFVPKALDNPATPTSQAPPVAAMPGTPVQPSIPTAPTPTSTTIPPRPGVSSGPSAQPWIVTTPAPTNPPQRTGSSPITPPGPRAVQVFTTEQIRMLDQCGVSYLPNGGFVVHEGESVWGVTDKIVRCFHPNLKRWQRINLVRGLVNGALSTVTLPNGAKGITMRNAKKRVVNNTTFHFTLDNLGRAVRILK